MMIDTHVHTCLSDGLETPETVVSLAAESGIRLLSITDHDRVKAYPSVISLGEARGVKVIPGVEMTTMDEPGFTCMHIVGLGIDICPEAVSVLDRVVKAQDAANMGFLDNVNDFLARRYPGWEPVTSIYPSVFMNALQNAKSMGLQVSEKEMLDVILNKDLWTPVELELTVDEAVGYIKKWGGVPVLAHPFDFSNDAGLVLKRFLAAGGEAVEVCKYRYKVRSDALSGLSHDELMKRERDMNLWTISQARKHGLKLTMASDHHDESRTMGMDPAEYGIDVQWLYQL
ncbi:PHP domain-containing protein [Methanocella arvoryzae]|uniref:Metal-dependent phosphoesterase (PHP family) n=1 Tax=Methanocella arvoryzae (strain DSM 22066 / NBRC 105507 / MRE50) TaxID=351160 RepID=Q0W457_METAR|nr:PHP domain-containing protein [Methanocella arvoryzae]CAJ36836.1 putative metal-dependent phosphoesterase (PHP family) [Methanocella arvoryzae MRE50]